MPREIGVFTKALIDPCTASFKVYFNDKLRCMSVNCFFRSFPITLVRHNGPVTMVDRRVIEEESPQSLNYHVQINLKKSQNLVKKLIQVSTEGNQIEVLNAKEIKYLIADIDLSTNKPRWLTDRREATRESLDKIEEVVQNAVIAKQPEPDPRIVTSDDGLCWKPVQ